MHISSDLCMEYFLDSENGTDSIYEISGVDFTLAEQIKQAFKDFTQTLTSLEDSDDESLLERQLNQHRLSARNDLNAVLDFPDYLALVLYGRVRFNKHGCLDWCNWLFFPEIPDWNELKTCILVHRDDHDLVNTLAEMSLLPLFKALTILRIKNNQGENDEQ